MEKNKKRIANSMELPRRNLFFISILFIVAGLFGMSRYAEIDFSPFISSPTGAYHKLSRWVEPLLNSESVHNFFLFDALFAFGIFILFGALYHFFTKRAKGQALSVKDKIAYFVFLLMLISDWTEGFMFCKYLTLSDKPAIFYVLPVIKFASYGIGTLILIYHGLKRLLLSEAYKTRKEVSKVFFKNYFSYLYLSLFSILALFLVFRSLDQFNVLIIELSEPMNLAIFSVLFLFHVLAVWFIPYYLQFTDKFYEKLKIDKHKHLEDGNIDVSRENIIVSSKNYDKLINWKRVFWTVTSVLRKEVKENYTGEEENTDEKIYKTVREMLAKVRPIVGAEYDKDFRANKFFHLIRRILGLGFIVTFYIIQYEAYCAMRQDDVNILFPVLFALVLLSTLLIVRKWITNEERRKQGLQITIVLGGLFLICVVLTQDNYEEDIFKALQYSLWATFFAGLGFIFFVVSRYPKEKKQDNKQEIVWAGKIRAGINLVIIFFLTALIPALTLFFFFYCVFKDFTFVNSINPTNIYLLLVTGLMGLGAVIDRSIKLRKIRKVKDLNKRIEKEKAEAQAYGKSESNAEQADTEINIIKTNVTWLVSGICILFFIIFIRSTENFHHEIHYLGSERASKLSFDEYLKSFSNKLNQNDTIYFIAAEGGGLRANYWTMLVLEELGQDVYDKTFMYSGASGGAIGQGLYTYLNTLPKYKDDDRKRIEYIDTIGRGNFLSTDVAGMFTRDLFGAMIPFKTPCYPDRHIFNAKPYFDLMGDTIFKNATDTPFHKIWSDKLNETHSPLIFVNTTRTEDGQRAVVHPFSPEENITDPYLDISYNFDKGQPSYLDAVWLTNRFPVASPAARIEGKGHFVDGGYYENTGIKTLVHLLGKMQARYVAGDTLYRKFFNHPIKVISIHNSTDSYISYLMRHDILGKYSYDSLNRSYRKKEISSIISAAANSGMTGLSHYYEELLYQAEYRELLCIADYEPIHLPYLLRPNDIHDYFKGQIVQEDFSLIDSLKINNERIRARMNGDKNVLMPPLSRMMTKSTANYMRQMSSE